MPENEQGTTTIEDLLNVINSANDEIIGLKTEIESIKKELKDTQELNRSLLKTKVQPQENQDFEKSALEKFNKYMEEKL